MNHGSLVSLFISSKYAQTEMIPCATLTLALMLKLQMQFDWSLNFFLIIQGHFGKQFI